MFNFTTITYQFSNLRVDLDANHLTTTEPTVPADIFTMEGPRTSKGFPTCDFSTNVFDRGDIECARGVLNPRIHESLDRLNAALSDSPTELRSRVLEDCISPLLVGIRDTVHLRKETVKRRMPFSRDPIHNKKLKRMLFEVLHRSIPAKGALKQLQEHIDARETLNHRSASVAVDHIIDAIRKLYFLIHIHDTY